ncbi:hypothetical protein CEXT_447841 [Caerostris extrusa]|uniref:Uncharacterized protein n=1 Tax=Caerostris extrusa TaxID=172846 RepID=A0AAV4V8Y0_CAEEX|nr:hypothetical protein CEXT_447841 [Caerostris extrusa]
MRTINNFERRTKRNFNFLLCHQKKRKIHNGTQKDTCLLCAISKKRPNILANHEPLPAASIIGRRRRRSLTHKGVPAFLRHRIP